MENFDLFCSSSFPFCSVSLSNKLKGDDDEEKCWLRNAEARNFMPNLEMEMASVAIWAKQSDYLEGLRFFQVHKKCHANNGSLVFFSFRPHQSFSWFHQIYHLPGILVLNQHWHSDLYSSWFLRNLLLVSDKYSWRGKVWKTFGKLLSWLRSRCEAISVSSQISCRFVTIQVKVCLSSDNCHLYF